MLKDFATDPYDLIVQAGQSNAQGTGYGEANEFFCENPNIWYLNANRTITPAAERVVNGQVCSDFSLAFAQDYCNRGLLRPGRKLLILRAAVGGTGFLDHHWGLQDDHYNTLLALTRTALELNPHNRLRAFLWHQGETDALFAAQPGCDPEQLYADHLHALFNGFRAHFSCPNLPFVAGDFVEHWIQGNQNNPNATLAPVRAALRRVVAELPRARFVATQGLLSNAEAKVPGHETDDIHFCRQALFALGHRYFESYIEVRDVLDID